MDGSLPPLYVSFGMSKSGSTFAFELTKQLLEQHGLPQPHLSERAVRDKDHINYAPTWDLAHVEAIIAESGAVPTTIVVKTHQKPSSVLVQRMVRGHAIGHAVFRDPRDMALSMLDAGTNARANDLQGFRTIHTMEDAIDKVDFQLEKFRAWVSLPMVEPIDFATLTTRPEVYGGVLSRQTGLSFDVDAAVVEVMDHAFIQFNKGVQHRHRDDMSRRDSERFRRRYADFYERYLPMAED